MDLGNSSLHGWDCNGFKWVQRKKTSCKKSVSFSVRGIYNISATYLMLEHRKPDERRNMHHCVQPTLNTGLSLPIRLDLCLI